MGELSPDFQKDIETVGNIPVVTSILEVVCRTTGMGFAAIARVTEDRWIACAVRDQIHFGLVPGGELKVETTICHEIRQSGRAVVIDKVSEDPDYAQHATPALYGFQSYISVPIVRKDGSFFGTLCAIDPKPAILKTPAAAEMFRLFAELISFHLAAADTLSSTQASLTMSQTSETRLRYLLEDAPVAIAVMKGRDLIVETANKLVLDIWGKQPDIVGKPLQVALPELKGQDFLVWLDEVYTKGVPFVGNEVKALLQRNGSIEEVYSDFVYQPIKNAAGETDSIMLVATVVTEQVKAKQQLKESEANLRMLADNISQLAWMADEQGNFYWFNQRWFDYTGTSFDEMQGWGWQKLHHPDHMVRVVEKYKNSIAGKAEIWEDTFPLRGADGSYRWFLSRAIPMKDANGNIIRWFGTNTDITEQRELSVQKDDFLGVISHELKTPITSLTASLQLLDRIKDAPENPLLPRLIEGATRSVKKITSLVDDLLTIRSFEEGQLQLEKTTFTIAEMLNLCCNHVRIAGTHELIIEGDKNLQVVADEHRIDQVVVNFVNNAVKYAPGAREIYLIISKEEGYAKIAVKDNGPGIEKGLQPHLFNRYWRANHGGGAYTGLGLGLYICAEIVKRHGGQIGVDSEPGKGSSFWFTIPLQAYD